MDYRTEMKRKSARTIDKTILLGATLCLAGNSYGVPSAALWRGVRQGHPYVPIVLLVVVSVLGTFDPFESWWARSMAERSVAIRRRFLSSFGKLLDLSGKIVPALDIGDLALHVWKKQRTPGHPVSGVLRRIATYRMSTYPSNRSFTPTKGVGVVGLCWEKNREVSRDVSSLASELVNEQKFEAYVARNGAESVMKLSWSQFENVKHRAAVFAMPIRNRRNRFVGCISVDASRGFDQLDHRRLMEEIGDLALAVGSDDFECT
jgi:hypothetical protein